MYKWLIRISHVQLKRKNRSGAFQLYGYDFILDSQFRVWLLEVCLMQDIGLFCDRYNALLQKRVFGLFCARQRALSGKKLGSFAQDIRPWMEKSHADQPRTSNCPLFSIAR